MVSRYAFLKHTSACATALALAPIGGGAAGLQVNQAMKKAAFAKWIWGNQRAENGMCRYYSGGPFADQISTLATSYAALFFLDVDVERAAKLGDALIAEQAKHLRAPHVDGGLPSAVNGPSPFYSSDALIALDVMMKLWAQTHLQKYLESATHLVRFLGRMIDGEAIGLLRENLGLPMQYVTVGGAYQNQIHPNVMMLHFGALGDFANKVDRTVIRTYEAGRARLIADAQCAEGAFYNYYDPGYPAKPYDRKRWRFYGSVKNDHVVIADNGFMSALGAIRLGASGNARRFLHWLGPVDGAFYAYLTVNGASSGFLPGRPRYFDVVTSGMYRALIDSLAEPHDTQYERSISFADRARSADGGYYWGIWEGGGFVQDNAEALVTGYWCTVY